MFLVLTYGMSKETKPYHHGDLRRALIETALNMLDEDKGWQFTLREVARRAGVSHAAPYKHFPDKAALLAELAEQGFTGLRNALEAARPSSPANLREEFLAMSRGYLLYGTSNPHLYSLMFSADARLAITVEMSAEAEAALDVLIGLIDHGQKAGWLRARDVRSQAVACWSQLHGLTLLTINGLLKFEKVGPNPSDEALAILLEGMEVRG
jgi:AcrR family transcriptional regulator